ncbi:MAG: alkaline phosphatase family protein [Solobacterium sp.]|nr:alkaline phosphatase family protein [Solobacterium sp.]
MKGLNPFLPFNYDFYSDIQNQKPEHISQKSFRFYHVEGAHRPFKYDKDVNVIPYEEGSYTQNVEASMKTADAFLKKLKEAGVYDNSSIMIMADHGFENGSDSNLDRFNPLLMIKGFKEKHPHAVSEAPISYLDLPEAYNRLLMHKKAEECFDAKEGDARERRVLLFVFQNEELIEEYIQDGYASDYENLKPTGKAYRR